MRARKEAESYRSLWREKYGIPIIDPRNLEATEEDIAYNLLVDKYHQKLWERARAKDPLLNDLMEDEKLRNAALAMVTPESTKELIINLQRVRNGGLTDDEMKAKTARPITIQIAPRKKVEP